MLRQRTTLSPQEEVQVRREKGRLALEETKKRPRSSRSAGRSISSGNIANHSHSISTAASSRSSRGANMNCSRRQIRSSSKTSTTQKNHVKRAHVKIIHIITSIIQCSSGSIG
mmetsp:Transcript_9529/g.14197  ORF Transcript_9529/g.14197 Transcript_9529/m.14197 type:complete len:113 (+) Transcript_9529:834-1172(+)